MFGTFLCVNIRGNLQISPKAQKETFTYPTMLPFLRTVLIDKIENSSYDIVYFLRCQIINKAILHCLIRVFSSKHVYNSKISCEKGLLKKQKSRVILKFFRANLNYFDSGFEFESLIYYL